MISLDSERTGINNSVKPFGAGDCKTKRPFLRRLISCLVMKSAQTSVLKADIPGKERVRLSNSVDSYHINTSLGVISIFSLKFSTLVIIKIKSNQLHAVSRTQQGRKREPSVNTLRSPLSAAFWRHCVLSGRTQLRA